MILERYSRDDYSLFTKINKNKKNDKITKYKKIVIVDKMGILTDFYQLADFVFVGGTLVDIGGHSILEPLYYGKSRLLGNIFKILRKL